MGKIYTALGLMSGTSMDGVDASIISSDGDREYSIKIDKYFKYNDELRQNLINIRDKVLLIDDLLATGGTVNAASELIKKVGGQLVGCGFIIELNELNGRENVPNVPVRSLIRYD